MDKEDNKLKTSILPRILVPILVIGGIAGLGYFGVLDKKHSEGGDHGGHNDHDDHDDHGEEGEHGESTVELSETAIELGGISTQKAVSKPVVTSIKINGKIIPNQDKFAHINPRFPGVVRAVHVNLGDEVKKGQTLATIEANGSLSRYKVKTKMAGIVVKKNVVQGEFVGDSKVIFSVANLDTVWIDLSVPETDFSKISAGQKVIIQSWESKATLESKVSYVSPIIYKDSQTLLARAVIENTDGLWRPGLFVTAKVIIDDSAVDIVVNRNAVQILEDQEVVFVQKDDEHFEARPVKLGRVGSNYFEILGGLAEGETYVSENSYILKADLLKSQAEHVH